MKMNVSYSFNDAYAQHAGLSIFSLFENNRDVDEITVYIIDNQISEDNKNKIETIASQYDRNIIYLDLQELTSGINAETSFNRSTYGRLFLSTLQDVDRILHIDSDTIITGSLKDLLTYDMSNTLVAGVQDTVNAFFKHSIGLSDEHKYINAGGVIILNLALWRQQQTSDKCLDFIMRYEGNPPHNDQGTLNYVCRDNIQILPANYNLMSPMILFSTEKIKRLFRMKTYYTQDELDDAYRNPIVIHFTDEFFNRPWFSNCNHPLKHYYLDFLAKSPWASAELKEKTMSKNCKIQNWVYNNCPFFVYESMIQFIYIRRRLKHKIK